MQEKLQFDLGGIEGLLCDHQHLDHCKAAKEVMRAGIDFYASEPTLEALCLTKNRRAKIIDNGAMVRLESFGVLPFAVNHGDIPCLGFVIREWRTGEYLLFVTDYVCLEQEFHHRPTRRKGHVLIPFSIIAIACNFSGEILQAAVDAGTINEALAKRILWSHPSKEAVKLYLREHCDLSKCREIHLLHMSRSNLDKAATRKEITDEFIVKTL